MLDPSFLNAVNTSIIPSADNTYDFGENTTPLRWRNGYFAGFIDVGSLQIGGTEVIDSSRNLKNIASATITSQLQIGSGTVSTDALADLFGDDTKFLRLRNPTDADDTNTIRNPPNIYLSGNVWDSENTTSVERHMGLFMEISDLNTYYLKFKNDSEQEILSLDGSGNMLISGDLQINGNDIKDSGGATRITLGATNTKITTDYGYVQIGPANSGYCHFITDRTQFYFNKQIVLNGNLIRYGNDKLFRILSASGGINYGAWIDLYSTGYSSGKGEAVIVITYDSSIPNDPYFRVKVNDVQGGTNTDKLTLDKSGNLWFAGDLQVGGNDIKDSGGNIRITLGSIVQFNSQIQFPNDQGQAILLPSADNQDFHIENVNGKFRIVRTGIDYAITVDGNNKRVGIWNDSPSYAFDVSGTFRATGDSVIGGDLQVNGGDIKDSGGAARIQFLSNFTRFLQKAVNVFDGNDVAAGTENSGYLLIGDPASTHLAIDNNEIMAKADGTTAGTLNLQLDGGAIVVGANLYPNSSNSKKLGLYTRVWQEVYTYRLFITKDSYSNSYEFFYHDWDTSPSDWSHAWAMHVKTKGGFFIHMDLDNNASSYPDNDTFTLTWGSSYTRRFYVKYNGDVYYDGSLHNFSPKLKETEEELIQQIRKEVNKPLAPRTPEGYLAHPVKWALATKKGIGKVVAVDEVEDPEEKRFGWQVLEKAFAKDVSLVALASGKLLLKLYDKIKNLEVRIDELEEKINSLIAS